MKKRLILLILGCLLCMCMGACGENEQIAKEEEKTIESGTLKVGCHIGYAPMEYYAEDGETLIGFDIELAQMLADELGLTLQIVPCAWDAIFNNVENRNYDLIISCVSYTKEREQKYSLTDSYLSNGLVLVVRNDSDIKNPDSLNDCSVGVQLETTADHLMRDYAKAGTNLELAQYESVLNAFEALERGDVDAICADSVVANYYLVEKDGYKVVWQSQEVEPICMCLAQNSSKLRDEINEVLKNMTESGQLKALSEKYFGLDLTTP